jgi:ATP-dependent Clp protease ATP-binding subunit ClpA
MRASIKRFNQSARNVLLRAYTATENSGHARIMDVHLFIAFLEDEGAAGKLLAEQGAETEKIRRVMNETLPASGKAPGGGGNLQMDETTQRVLERAVEIARQKNTDSISAEQLLFALLKNASGPLKKAMASCGLDGDKLCERLEPLLAVSTGTSELVDLLETLEACRRLFDPQDVHRQRLGRIEDILQEYYSAK